MATATTLLLLVPTDEIANGMFNVEGFNQIGLLGASLVFLVIVSSALGTHSFSPTAATWRAVRVLWRGPW